MTATVVLFSLSLQSWCKLATRPQPFTVTADAKQTSFYFLPTCIHASFSQSKLLWISCFFEMIVDLILVFLFKYVIKWQNKRSTLVMSVVFHLLSLTITTTCSLRAVAHCHRNVVYIPIPRSFVFPPTQWSGQTQHKDKVNIRKLCKQSICHAWPCWVSAAKPVIA